MRKFILALAAFCLLLIPAGAGANAAGAAQPNEGPHHYIYGSITCKGYETAEIHTKFIGDIYMVITSNMVFRHSNLIAHRTLAGTTGAVYYNWAVGDITPNDPNTYIWYVHPDCAIYTR